ncbi:hypothetical protein AURDEDRAFT_173416 [Auricularia subglabra TFB-10046 SS5]|uniref:Uncharacterized protein n=1 Tax=Auricularia subglabra (strain TFB-10046 / SS5) TaxID=717982 RepID=J0D019_AURST|nr:hypothetical protein AURDEDRAFT_173416 [Auricularia subglabra TFB-10046 SS5]
MGLAASSLLLVIRAVAIAKCNRWAMLVLGSLWLAEVAMQFHSLVLIRGVYVPQLFACGPTNTVVSRLYMLVSFVLHFVCLALVLFILLRIPGDGLCHLLLSQGIVYFVVSMLGFTSSSVLLVLNLNDGMNLSLQVPTLAALAICATRMYRGLVIYANTDNDAFTMTVSYDTTLFLNGALAADSKCSLYSAEQIAQSVQYSEFPDRYDQAEGAAKGLIAQAQRQAGLLAVSTPALSASTSAPVPIISSSGGTVITTSVPLTTFSTPSPIGMSSLRIGLSTGDAGIEGIYVPQLFACAVTRTVQSRLNMVFSFSVNFVCLALVLFFLMKSPGDGLWNLLLSQGVIYFAVVMVAYIPPMVLLLLNLNDGVNLSLQSPALVALVICATRMHRALVAFNEKGQNAFMRPPTWMNTGPVTPTNSIAIRVDRVKTIVLSRDADSEQGADKVDATSERSLDEV